MTDDNIIDAEITHVEDHIETHDEFIDLGDDPDGDLEGYDGGITIVTPEEYIERTPERRGQELQRQVVAVRTPETVDDLDFTEDFTVLRLLYNKIFRWAIIRDATLPETLEIESELRDHYGQDLTDAITDLDDAREGKTDLDWQLAEWRNELLPLSRPIERISS